MATYAALVSLLNVIDHIQNHPRLSFCLDKKQVESLCQKIEFLLEFIESDCDGVKSEEEEVLEREIACAAYAAEDVIESHIVDQILGKLTTTSHEMINPIKETRSISFSGLKNAMKDMKRKVTKVKEQRKFQDSIQSHSISLLDLETVIQDIDSVIEKVREQRRFQEVQPSTYVSSFPTSPTPHHLNTNKMVIGFDDELIRLLDELTGNQSALQIISIVGMGGIGKTTLARTVYEHPLISQKFDIRSWVTISQQYSVREILSQLLSCKTSDETDEHELGEQLYKSLIGRRYLIVLDDMWSRVAWHDIKQFFPDNKNTSRILVTTRLSDTAAHLGTSLLAMKFLDEAQSWELFCENAFPRLQGCLGELEEIGRKIVKKCVGLPLSITVTGALLSKSPSTEYWENISQKMNSILDFGDESLDILSLSYIHLPAHLKPCFLYMGVFPEDHKIRVSRLIRLWVSEGFVKPNKTQSLEEIAEGYLKDLIDRNLILVHRLSWMDGKMEMCQMHDLLRDLCLKIAQKEKFLCVMRSDHDVRQGIDKERRLVFHEKIQGSDAKKKKTEKITGSKYGLEPASLTRSLVSVNPLPIRSRLLRVLDTFYDPLPLAEMMVPVNLRYVCIAHSKQAMESKSSDRILSSISLFWNLQTLRVCRDRVGRIEAPHAIWQMLQLRHVDINNLHLPDPPSYPPSSQSVLRNLQTLKHVSVSGLNREVLKRIPNIRELEITYEGFHKHLPEDFGRLHKLESLDLTWYRLSTASLLNGDCLLPAKIQFPSSLQKLTLRSCALHWEQMTLIGALPNLEVLRLHYDSVMGSEWSPVEGQFLGLKFLEIDDCGYLLNWNADSSHFPVLEKLVLRCLKDLNEIPSGIGDITTLRLIDVINSSDSAAFSAMGILAEQESLGYEDLQLRIMFWNEEEVRRFKKKAEQLEGFTSTRLQICTGFGLGIPELDGDD